MSKRNDDARQQDCLLQISAGQGPRECAWLVNKVMQRLIAEARNERVGCELVEGRAFDKLLRDQDVIAVDAYTSVTLRLRGDEVVSHLLERWIGVIKWHGQSPYRPRHKRLNWFVSVERISAAMETNIDFDRVKRDTHFQSIRSGGPGGQHVNKTSSAVRATHQPSGISVRVDDDRSQHRNKARAVARIVEMLEAERNKGNALARDQHWQLHKQVERGNPVRVFKGLEFEEC